MTEIATIDWFERWGTSVFSENTAIFKIKYCLTESLVQPGGGSPAFNVMVIHDQRQ